MPTPNAVGTVSKIADVSVPITTVPEPAGAPAPAGPSKVLLLMISVTSVKFDSNALTTAVFAALSLAWQKSK